MTTESANSATLPLSGLATAVSVLLGCSAAVCLVAAFQSFDLAGFVAAYRDQPAPESMLPVVASEESDSRTWGLLAGAFFVPTGIVFIIWQHRHATNAVALRGSLRWGPGWAIGAWFIPLMNLVMPFRQLNEAARASDPAVAAGGRGTVPPVQVAWTSVFLGALLLYAIGNSLEPRTVFPGTDRTRVIDDFVLAQRLHGIAMLAYLVAAGLAILTVRTLTRRQHQSIADAADSRSAS